MPLIPVGFLILVWQESGHYSYRGPDPATGRVVEMRTKYGDPYYVTPREKQIETWRGPALGGVLFLWYWLLRKTAPQQSTTKA